MIGSTALLAACALNSFGDYNVLSADVSHPHPSLERVAYQVEVGHQSLNRFTITHVSKKNGTHAGTLMLLSPFMFPGAFYEATETGEYAKSAAGELAQAGYDIWLVDQRHTGLAPGSCESTVDCSVMATWDNNAASEDALFTLSLIRSFNPWEKPAVGGFSAGSVAAMSTVNRAPDEFSGLFMYEGTFFTKDPAIIAHNDPICTTLQTETAAGTVFDPSFAVFGTVLGLAHTDPNGLSPIPLFPPGTTNFQSMLFVFGTPPPAGALSPTATFVRARVDFSTDTFVYTNPQRLELVGPLFDNYGSLPALRDLACGLSGRDDEFFKNLGQFRGNVLIKVEGTGFGQAMFDTAGLFDHARRVDVDSNPELGESDPYFGFRWKQNFLQPLEAWLRRTL
jgi:pimeloyl-ACP methyl ester carboxylesterase